MIRITTGKAQQKTVPKTRHWQVAASGPPNPKIFQIGFNRCGTSSLYNFFLDNNIRATHWHGGEIGLEIARNARIEQRLLGPYEDRFDAFTDMEEHHTQNFGPHHFKQLHKEHPTGFFILNTRPVDKWVKSRFNLHKGKFAQECSEALRLPPEQLEAFWIAEWHSHHQRVKEHFKDYTRFLVFDIETDDGNVLRDFLSAEYDLDPAHWGHHFPTPTVEPAEPAP